MKTPDEKLQESIEQGMFESSDLDSQAYHIVFGAAKKEPLVHLSPQFSNKVINQIIEIEEKRASQKDFIWLGLGVFVLTITALVTIFLTGFKPDSGAFKFVGNYGGLLVFAALLIGLFHWVEKKVLPRHRPI
ncbi:MAG: hypothetical protein ABJH04_13035 [Cyclobacteriaceae bacterium]